MVRYISRFQEDGASNEDDFRLLKSSSASEKGRFGEEGGVTEDIVISSISPNTSKYQFTFGREIHGFIEEPESISCIMHQFYTENYDSKASSVQIEIPPDESPGESASVETEEEDGLEKEEQEVLSEQGHGDSEEEDEFRSENDNEILAAEEDFREVNFEWESMDEKKWDYFDEGLGTDEKMKQELDYMVPEIQVFGEDDIIPSDTESNSMNSSVECSAESNHEDDIIRSLIEGQESEKVEEIEENFDQFCNSDDEYIELELQTQDSVPELAEVPPLEDFEKLKEENIKPEETFRREEPSVISDEEDELGILPEHDDVIEQLKRELRSIRTGGLPTIWEDGSEVESPTINHSLKQLKIDRKYEQKDRRDESQMVYKAYEEKMKKLDILNDQTMHAIGILQLKNQNRPIWRQKSSVPAFKPFISHNFWPRKSQKSVADSSLKFIGDLQKELELVYVGQVCLSWEILYWQHRKVLELQEHGSKGLDQCMFNRVASDFQTFQILIERFIENDQFHQSRVENYVKNRCVMRKFLQVPAIKGDCLKETNVIKGKEAVIDGILAQMIEELMRVFHEFIRTDKDVGKQTQTDLEDPADSALLDDTRAALQKKEKKLKDIIRSKNCIVKKLHKYKEERVKYTVVVAQVELKLVSRVLSMSKLSQSQLHWCVEKLNQVILLRGKVHIQPSFLLFPC